MQTDQVAALKNADIAAGMINGNTPYEERSRLLRDLATGHPLTRLLYVTPEQCATEAFRKHLRVVYEQQELARIAVDEAHCISEWGHDFRKSFKDLRWLRENFPEVPIICLTATATAQVREDIISILGLVEANMRVYTMTTDRKNLHYEVRFKSDEESHYPSLYSTSPSQDLPILCPLSCRSRATLANVSLVDFLGWLRTVHKRRAENVERRRELERNRERIDNVSGIIYTIFRNDCEDIAAKLRADGIGARPYHAGLHKDEKDETLQRWVNNEKGYDVIVATTAFGMGIDKEDVRFVVHWQLPKSFEGYYQEAGRAGRDGKASICIMYYSREDRDRAFNRLSKDTMDKNNFTARVKSLQAVIDYCENTDSCRHRQVCKYFGEAEIPDCDYACDWHKDGKALKKAKMNGLASEEWVSTQRDLGVYNTGYDGYDST